MKCVDLCLDRYAESLLRTDIQDMLDELEEIPQAKLSKEQKKRMKALEEALEEGGDTLYAVLTIKQLGKCLPKVLAERRNETFEATVALMDSYHRKRLSNPALVEAARKQLRRCARNIELEVDGRKAFGDKPAIEGSGSYEESKVPCRALNFHYIMGHDTKTYAHTTDAYNFEKELPDFPASKDRELYMKMNTLAYGNFIKNSSKVVTTLNDYFRCVPFLDPPVKPLRLHFFGSPRVTAPRNRGIPTVYANLRQPNR